MKQTALFFSFFFFLAGAANASAYEDMQNCENSRPKICGQQGAPSCRDVQSRIDQCKAAVKEAEVRRINAEGEKQKNKK